MTDEVKLRALIGEGIKSHEERKEAWILAGKPGERPTIMDSIADHLLANGVTFATDNHVGGKWIPVTERLPETGGSYLVYTERGSVYASHFYTEKKFASGYVREASWSQRGKVKVTHWMPLPEPPDANAGCEEAVMDDPNAWFKEVSIAGCWPDEAEEMKRSHLFVQLSRYKKFVEPVKGEIGMLAGVRFFVKGGDSE